MPSTPVLDVALDGPPISGVAEREKSLTHQVNASQVSSSLHTLLLDAPRLLLASLSAQADPLSEKADLMSRHVPLLRWTLRALQETTRRLEQDKKKSAAQREVSM